MNTVHNGLYVLSTFDYTYFLHLCLRYMTLLLCFVYSITFYLRGVLYCFHLMKGVIVSLSFLLLLI